MDASDRKGTFLLEVHATRHQMSRVGEWLNRTRTTRMRYSPMYGSLDAFAQGASRVLAVGVTLAAYSHAHVDQKRHYDVDPNGTADDSPVAAD